MSATEPDTGEAARTILSTKAALAALGQGELEVGSLLPWGSNYTFLATIHHTDHLQFPVVYKPQRGERPLWDFPEGTLAKREVAAYFVSEMLGWSFVPPTVLRDGPHGPGSVQLFIDFDPNHHYFNMSEEQKPRLQRVVLFDYLTNNADRKGGHIVLDPEEHLWLLDHGICFHAEYKLRTVVWDFAGLPFPEAIQTELESFKKMFEADAEFVSALQELLSAREIGALQRRTIDLLEAGCFPNPGPGRNYPWPPL